MQISELSWMLSSSTRHAAHSLGRLPIRGQCKSDPSPSLPMPISGPTTYRVCAIQRTSYTILQALSGTDTAVGETRMHLVSLLYYANASVGLLRPHLFLSLCADGTFTEHVVFTWCMCHKTYLQLRRPCRSLYSAPPSSCLEVPFSSSSTP